MADSIRTERLVLRRWREDDKEPFAALNADPVVMEHFPATLSREESDALAERIEAGFDEHGFGLWAVEADGEFIGFTGLSVPRFTAPFTPCVEIGWRLARSAWGRGYATEAARASLEDGFGRAGLTEVVSFTAVPNVRSQAVMRRLGMTRDPAEDFDHPALPAGHPLRRHVLYRIRPYGIRPYGIRPYGIRRH
ncbi:GNAT family N-acetyltransferase [Microbispora hainanensis]|uniref:GNAT family N-acetyltransferase n=1 Tax=Microbispora hainanensis TaxID=568844 RepID=UPI0033D96806